MSDGYCSEDKDLECTYNVKFYNQQNGDICSLIECENCCKNGGCATTIDCLKIFDIAIVIFFTSFFALMA